MICLKYIKNINAIFILFLFSFMIHFITTRKIMNKSQLQPLKLFQDVIQLDANTSYVRLPTKEEHLVENLPGLPSTFNLKHYAGHLPVSTNFKGGQLFYWLFEADEKPEEKPLIIWLNGGPGCSSLEGLFLELGPLKIDPTNETKLIENPFGWHKAANIMFIDQPVGTGLSFPGESNYARNEKEVDEHFYHFFQNFLTVHPEYILSNTTSTTNNDSNNEVLRTRPIFFTGESYAGRYIPNIVSHMLEMNKNINNDNNNIYISVGGAAIGNGWSHPKYQYDYSTFAYASGLISTDQSLLLKEQYNLCQNDLNSGITLSEECGAILDMILQQSSVPNGATLNTYDIRSYIGRNESWPSNEPLIGKYLNNINVRKALHAILTPHEWYACSAPVFDHLEHEDGISSTDTIENILNTKNIPILFYNGQFDLICNHLGTETFLNELNWYGLTYFIQAPRYVWSAGTKEKPSGYVKSTPDHLLTFLVFLGGSHMVPMDRPMEALDMIIRFINKRTYNDYLQTFLLDIVAKKKNKNNKNIKLLTKKSIQFIKNTINDLNNNEISIYSICLFGILCIMGIIVLFIIRSHWKRKMYIPLEKQKLVNFIQT